MDPERCPSYGDLSEKRQCHHDGELGNYAVIGAGEQAVVMLPGGAGDGSNWSDMAVGLSERFHCIVLDYPPVTSVEVLIDGVGAVLDAEGVSRAHLIGTSLGGMLAQAFPERAPDRARSLVLGNTGIYDERTYRDFAQGFAQRAGAHGGCCGGE